MRILVLSGSLLFLPSFSHYRTLAPHDATGGPGNKRVHAARLRARKTITYRFSISSSGRLCPFLNREILNVGLLRFRFRSIDHGQIQPKSERIIRQFIVLRALTPCFLPFVLAFPVSHLNNSPIDDTNTLTTIYTLQLFNNFQIVASKFMPVKAKDKIRHPNS
jgi:hypothetical protein